MDIDRVLDLLSWGREHVSLDTPVDDDGVIRLVLSHTDPGVANWLDASGRRSGLLVVVIDEDDTVGVRGASSRGIFPVRTKLL
mgnify:CR=1 FL=1